MFSLHRLYRVGSSGNRLFGSAALISMERTKVIENGSKLDFGIFSEAEMNRRVSSAHSIMEEEEMDYAIFTSYHNICYLSQFLHCRFGRKYALILDQNNKSETNLIAANIDGGGPWRYSSKSTKVALYTDWQRDNFYFAIQQIINQNPSSKVFKIGIEFDDVSVQTLQELKEYFGTNQYDFEFVDISHKLMKFRMIKSIEEHNLIRNGAQIADIGGFAAVNAIKNGLNKEYEIGMEATNQMIKQIALRYGEKTDIDLMDSWVWFQSGINTDGAHNATTSKQLKYGDILSLNCFPMIRGYYTALERTLFFEHIPSDRHLKLWQINCEVHRRGLELIGPNVRCSDIANELNEIYAQNDLLSFRTFGYGHSFGVLCHYYGRESGLELREDNDTMLEEGMVVSMEPCFTIPNGMSGYGGYREHDILIVNVNGAENITKFPFGPEHNVITTK